MTAIVVLDHRDPRTAVQMRDVQRASYRVEADLIGFDRMPPLLEDAEQIVHLDLTVLGAVEGDAVRGVLGYTRDAGAVEIDRLAVHPEQFRRGIGRSLLGALHGREPDAHRFVVSTGVDNEPAIRLYRAMGYEISHEEVVEGVEIVHLVRVPVAGLLTDPAPG